jgi:hypothetical protein
VLVPTERVIEFYGMLGPWLAGSTAGESAGSELEPWSDNDLVLAVTVWGKLSPAARQLFSVLMESPEEPVSSEELAEHLHLPNAYGVAGVLAWPGRHSYKVGREFPIIWEQGTDDESARYWMTSDVAALFRQARDAE